MSTINYTVKEGDWLSKIASRYNTDIGSISGYRSGDPNKIYPGEKLTINLKDISNVPEVPTATVEKAQDKPYNKPEVLNKPDLSYITNQTYDEKDIEPAIKASNNTQLALEELSNQINGLYDKVKNKGQDKVDLQKQYNIADTEKTLNDLTNQLKMIQSARDMIPLQLEQDAEGRTITKSGIEPISASKLRENTIQQYNIAAQIEAYRGNLESANTAIQIALDQKYAPIEYELEVASKKFDNIYDTFSKVNSTYGKTFTNLSKLKQQQLEKDKEEIAKQKEFETNKYKVLNRLMENRAPKSVLTAVANATTLEDIYKSVGVYGENPASIRARENIANKRWMLQYKKTSGNSNSSNNSGNYITITPK